MPDESNSKVRAEIKAKVLELSKLEQQLLSEVVRIERENLHIKQPRLKAELVAKVKEMIK